jgi:hypothetical protein
MPTPKTKPKHTPKQMRGPMPRKTQIQMLMPLQMIFRMPMQMQIMSLLPAPFPIENKKSNDSRN